MVLLKKEILLESDFAMCLGYLWKYELHDADDVSDVISRAIKIKKSYLQQVQPKSPDRLTDKDLENIDDLFDFDNIEGDSQITRNSLDSRNLKLITPSRQSKQKQNTLKQGVVNKLIPNFFRKDSSISQDAKSVEAQNSKNKDKNTDKKERMNRNLLISQRNLSILSETNATPADELNTIQ